MSGAQGKAVTIAKGAGIMPEVDKYRIDMRKNQGWITDVTDSPHKAFKLAREAQKAKRGRAIAFYGNIVDLLEYTVLRQYTIGLNNMWYTNKRRS